MNLQPWESLNPRSRDAQESSDRRGYAGHLARTAVKLVLATVGERPKQQTFDEGRLSERI
jgi:hypothetical protein